MNQCPTAQGNGLHSRNRHVASLDYFLAGPENGLLELAAASVADDWVRFNPLFIFGAPGAGKTHLLHCLVETSRMAYTGLHSTWMTGADYGRAIANGVDVDSLVEVRDLHRSVDMFVLDGLHELAAKPLAQQELIHTIDYHLQQNSHVIVSSRSALEELHSLNPSLASRLASGLAIPLAPPTGLTRDVILTEMAQQSDVDVPLQVRQRLTSDVNRHRSKPLMVNDLRAAITELSCFPELDHQAITTLERITSPLDDAPKVTAREINKRVARYFNVTVRELTGNSRRKTIVRARALSAYLTRTLVGSSFQMIGENLGGRDHSTAMHAFRRACEWLDSDPGFAHAATKLRASFE